MEKSGKLTAETAEAVAIKGLAFIAADPVLLPRFLALTGLQPLQLRRAAREAGFLPGVLEFILAHEPTLQAFCEAESLHPQTVAAARQTLAGSEEVYD
ncbi:DUF3572 domain-containing protein [Jiella mangrovi]|uniref:DUF3572 domain-containing protein n=1 Tax=Jiella mangrovi TaxID=2821407 RepID=A0ABS4BE72_9HYPH|nr:DUF3572 domain-containing protein [Jiella mangrovi]MBP0615062.1 DUF3572 domain-containing protein [Jiella mangrovi]